MNLYRIGKLNDFNGDGISEQKIKMNINSEIKQDFEKLRKLAIEMVSKCILMKIFVSKEEIQRFREFVKETC